MKKNFFKKLSFVLALAMIVSTIAPAAGAFAATSPKINSAKQYLTLGQTSEYDFSVANKIAGSTYKWSTSNKAVVTVDQKGLAVAKSVGTAKVTVKVTTKKKKTYTSSATVIVKDNFKSLTITGAPADGKVAVGAEVTLATTGTTFGGAASSTTAIVRFAVTDKDGKVATGAAITDAGVFKATVAGTYTVTANAFQSTAKYDAWKTSGKGATATASTTLTVANTATLAQVDQTSFKLTFSSPVESLAVADVAVNYLIGTTEVGSTVKSVTLSTDKLSATVVLYAGFSAGSTYNVTVKGFDKITFVAAKTELADVASMTITPATVAVNNATKVIVKLFNKDGIDITTATLLGKVTVASSSEKVYLSGSSADTNNVNPYKLTFYNVGDATTLTATLHSYTYDTTTGTEKDTKTATATVTGVATTTYLASGITAWTLEGSLKTDFSTANHTLAVEDAAKVLSVKTVKNDSDATVVYSATSAANFKFESSDPSVVIVNGTSVYPVKAGSASIIVYYTADPSASTVVWNVVGALPITVGAKRVATTLNLGSYAFALTSSPAVAETKSVSIEVLDQYGTVCTLSSPTIEQTNTQVTSNLVSSTAPNSIVFAGSGATAGQYSYKITSSGLTKYVIITVNDPASTTASYYRLSLDATSYDQKLTSSNLTHNVSATVSVLGYATNGIATTKETVTGSTYKLKLYDPNGTEQTSLLSTTGSTPKFATLDIYTGNSVSGAATTALATGTWTVKLYTVSGSTDTLKDTASIVIKDTTTVPTITTKTLSPSDATLNAAINSVFTATLNGNTLSGLFVIASDVVGQGNTVYVKNIRYYDSLTHYTYVIPVSTNVKLTFSYTGTVN